MEFYDELRSFLRGMDDFFVEVEGTREKLEGFIQKYNSETGKSITMVTEGICRLNDSVNKWGLEFRL